MVGLESHGPRSPQTHPLLGVDFPECGWGVLLPEGGPGSAFSLFWGGGSDPPGGARRPGRDEEVRGALRGPQDGVGNCPCSTVSL